VTQEAVRQQRAWAAGLSVAAVGLTALASGIVPAPLLTTLSEFAFPLRAATLGVRLAFDENTRVLRERLTEEGHLTQDELEWFVNQIFASAGAKDLTDRQLLDVSGATDQFWDNYWETKNQQLETGRGATWDQQARANMIIAKVGEFTSTLARILNIDPGSLSPFDASRWPGRSQRAVILLTYMTNVASSIQSVLAGAFANPLLGATSVAFLGANIIGGGLSVAGLSGGMARRGVETHPIYQRVMAKLQTLFTGAGLVWASGVGFQIVVDAISGNIPKMVFDVADLVAVIDYIYGQYRSHVNENAKVNAKPQVHSKLQLRTIVIILIGLAISQLIKAAEEHGWFALNGSNAKPQGQTPTSTPTSTPTPTPTPTPTQPPVSTPLPPTSFPTSPQNNHFPGNPNPAGYNTQANGANYVKVTPGESLWQIATDVVLKRNQIENLHPTPDRLNAQILQELQLIEKFNPQIVQNGGSGTYDLIWAGDEIDVPNLAQIPGIAPQANAIPGWAINGNVPGTVLPAGLKLNIGDRYTSPNGKYELVMRFDGDLVLYLNNSNGTQTQIFDTGTYGVGAYAVIQSNGNLVVYAANNNSEKPGDVVVWQSNTGSAADAYSVLAIQDDGNLVIYAKGGATWDAQDDSINGRLIGKPPKDAFGTGPR
jgi:hypothetical protein